MSAGGCALQDRGLLRQAETRKGRCQPWTVPGGVAGGPRPSADAGRAHVAEAALRDSEARSTAIYRQQCAALSRSTSGGSSPRSTRLQSASLATRRVKCWTERPLLTFYQQEEHDGYLGASPDG